MKGPSAGVLAATALAAVLAACASPESVAGPAAKPARSCDELHPAVWIDDAGLSTAGFGQVAWKTGDGHALIARVYRARSFDPATGPIWFVMHGASRDAERYVEAAAPVAERYGALAIVPHFTKEAYPKGEDYTLGITTTYPEIERLFESVRRSLRGRQHGYFLFGHSAGAQFTHRLLTFLPGARALGAVAANAGWYTLPTDDDPRTSSMPYGLKGSSIGTRNLRAFFGLPFVVLLGDRDVTTAETDELVRGTPEAEAQGATRLARGRHYFEVAKAKARDMKTEFAWRLAIVPRAGHDAAGMIDSAGFFLFAPGESPCVAGRAADAVGLSITEILADPPAGPSGDANGDGVRDPSDDEFVEIVNTGKSPVCLSGWTLGDAKDPARHVFPLGRALGPGRTLVVFGGGVPVGRFGGAEVQWATGGLNLSNDGDVITVRDGSDAIVRQVSWGDCDGSPCAADHWPGRLDFGGSLVRRSEPRSAWSEHVSVAGLRHSPGVNAGGVRR